MWVHVLGKRWKDWKLNQSAMTDTFLDTDTKPPLPCNILEICEEVSELGCFTQNGWQAPVRLLGAAEWLQESLCNPQHDP